MSVLQALILGAIQGLSEFLPVSSSGHLVLARSLMSIEGIPVLFDVLLHLATLLVVLIVFRRIIGRIIGAVVRALAKKGTDDDRSHLRLLLVVVVASAVTAVVGLGVSMLDVQERPDIVSALLIVTAAILVFAHLYRRARPSGREYGELRIADGLVTGAAQGLGVFPGISRSGITISGALVAGLSRRKAGEFAFLISIPAIVGALILTLRDAGELSAAVSPPALIAGVASSFVVGMVSLLALLRLIQSGKLYLFAFYLVPAGVLGLVFLR